MRRQEVVVRIGLERFPPRGAHAGNSRQMEYMINALEKLCEVDLLQQAFDQAETRLLQRARDLRELALAGVVIEKGIDPNNLVALREQMLCQMRADESGRSGNEVSQRSPFSAAACSAFAAATGSSAP